MKVYLAGPMGSKPMFNFQVFEECSQWLQYAFDWDVVSPHQLDIDSGRMDYTCRTEHGDDYSFRQFSSVNMSGTYNKRDALADDMRNMLNCDKFIIMDGWQEAYGVIKQIMVAKWMGMELLQISRTSNGYQLSRTEIAETTLAYLYNAHANGYKVTTA